MGFNLRMAVRLLPKSDISLTSGFCSSTIGRHRLISSYPSALYCGLTQDKNVARQRRFAENSRISERFCKFSTQTSKQGKKPSLYQRFKTMYKEYWYVLLPVHLTTSAVWLGGFYYLAISGVDIAALLDVCGAPDAWVTTLRESKAGGIVTAYTMYKIATPARYTVTLGGTTLSINYLKKKGWIKPIPSREELKVMYDEQKTVFKDKLSSTKEEIKDEFVKTGHEIVHQMKEAKTGIRTGVRDAKTDLKEGILYMKEEWKHIFKLAKLRTKEFFRPPKPE